MKRKILILTALCSFSFILIYCLHTICLEQNLKIGNFERNLINKKLNKIEEIVLPVDASNFIGFTNNCIYLSLDKLDRILKYDLKTKQSIIKKLNHINHNSNILRDSLFSFDPRTRKMYVYDTKTLNFITETSLKVGFDRALAIDKNTILLRSANADYSKMVFSAFDLKTKSNSKLRIQSNDSLEVDGGLKTDGFFSYNDSIVIFTQYKKGNFYKINKSLNQIIHYSTLDNIQNVEGVRRSIDSSYYFDKPVLNSNLLTSIFKSRLYVISFVKSTTDKLNQFTKFRMVDVYSLKTGKYQESFYLPNNGIHKTNNFYISENKIYLLFNNKILIYELN